MVTQGIQKVAVVTGASSGIGKEAAKALAGQGWRIIALGRDPQRAAAAEAEIRDACRDGGEVTMILADLALLADAARAARDIAALTDRIDVLINNAGGMASRQVITSEGHEANFTGNHLGPFLLTSHLLPLLRHAAAGLPPGRVRIINTSSNASEMVQGFDWNDLELLKGFDAGRAYCQSKLANVLFARGLARRLAPEGIVAHALHPGVIASNFIAHASETTQAYIRTLEAISPEEGARALVWLAIGDEPGRSSGGYYHQHTLATPNPLADDDTLVDRLWMESERLLEAVPG